MITGSKEADSPEKGEGNASNDGKFCRASSSSTTPWLRFKDPRIVRVSRAFGGKDRHSKVYTIRGLRDRRVRLSVPTAIQLYDLQDRLGLNQPSKVVDWLLNAAKQEIEDLPPLPIPSGNISLNHQAMFSSSSLEIDVSQSNEGGFKARTGLEDLGGLSRTNFWSTSSQALSGTKSKEVSRDPINMKEGWRKGSDHEDKDERNEGHNAMPYASLFHLETPSFPLGSHGFDAQTEDLHNISNALPLPSALSLSSGSQILVCPTPLPGTTHPYFPSHVAASSMEIDPRQINHFQMMTSSTQNFLPDSPAPSPYSLGQSMRPFHFSVTPRFLHSKQHSETHPDKEQELPSK